MFNVIPNNIRSYIVSKAGFLGVYKFIQPNKNPNMFIRSYLSLFWYAILTDLHGIHS